MKKAVKFLLENQCAGLLLDPGLGKTSITLAAFSMLLKYQTATAMLVVAPLRPCHLVWPPEAKKWVEFNHLDMVVLHGTHKERLALEKHDIYVVNFEGLEWLITSGILKQMIKNGLDVLTIDELSKFKHSNTKRFKALKPYLSKFARRWGLTGSPAANGLLDLFGQCYILDMGNALGPFITHYRANYFDSVGYGGFTYAPKPGAEKAIYARIKPLMLRMDADDYLQLPQKMDNIIKVDLEPKARKAYDAMEEDLVAELDASTVTAVSSGVASMKCRQIASGAIYLDHVDPLTGMPRTGKRQFEVIHDAKLAALSELRDELQGQPILVAYEFQHELDRIKKRFGEVPVIGSGTSTKRAAELEAAWNNNELEWLFGHPASMGHGLNLQSGQACHVCWFNTTWDYELYDQFNRRIRRQGNKNVRFFCHHIVVRNSVDEAVMNAIRTKRKNQSALLDALNTYRGRKRELSRV